MAQKKTDEKKTGQKEKKTKKRDENKTRIVMQYNSIHWKDQRTRQRLMWV